MAGDFLSIIKPTDKSKTGEAENGEKTAKKALPVLPVRDTVLFPHAVLPLTVGRESSIQLINSLGEEKQILVVAQRDARQDTPQAADLHSIGTLATIHKVVKMPNQKPLRLHGGHGARAPGRVCAADAVHDGGGASL